MPKFPRKTVLLAALCASALSQASGQSAPPASAASAPTLGHRSAFEGYRPFAAEETQPWRQSNDTARDIGGWRAYAREMRAPAAARAAGASAPQGAAPATPEAARPAADPHAGHKQ
jgi:hypothetical protein